ncbi:hypothetical protein AAIR98_001191 [Elusimicrobium simillimum]|uniref:hypothetical protein n=1 Tax=Elusimicrobium simillimum TaxID=3143438 RepID=UPI003C6EC73E
MKKLLLITGVLTAAVFAAAGTIESVAFHPAPSGKYAKLSVSNTLNAGASNTTAANISRLVAKGNLDLVSSQSKAAAGRLLVTESMAIRGSGAEVDIKGVADIKTAHASKKFITPGTKFTASNIIGAQKTKPVFKARNNDTVDFKKGLSASSTLRWLQLTDVDGKKHMILVEDSSSEGKECPAEGVARACCLNPAGNDCVTHPDWQANLQAAVKKSGLRNAAAQ